jgi:hypothetical protein
MVKFSVSERLACKVLGQHRSNEVLAAYSKLYTMPHWECGVTPNDVRWTCLHKKRKYFVVWEATGSKRIPQV